MATTISAGPLLQAVAKLQGEKLHQDDLEDLLDLASESGGEVDDTEKLIIADAYVSHARAGKTTERADKFYKDLEKSAQFPSRKSVADSWDSGS
jgi:hypothetical protein